VASVAITAVFTLRQQKIYAASASLVIDFSAPQVLGEGIRDAVDLGAGGYWQSKEFYETQYKIIRSRTLAERVVADLGLDRDMEFLGIDKLSVDDRKKALEKIDPVKVLLLKLSIEPVKDSQIVNLKVEDSSPERATEIANAFANVYMQFNLERRVDSSKDAASWLHDQLADLKNKLTTSEVALYSFKKDNDLIYTTLENKQTITSQKLMAVDESLTKIRTRKAELDARVKAIQEAKEADDPNAIMELGVVASNMFVNQLKVNYLQIAGEASDLRERYGPEHPRMKAAEEKLSVAKKSMVSEIDAILGASISEYRELVDTERNLAAMLGSVKKEAFETNKKEIDYKRLAREEENNQRLFELVIKRIKELELASLLKANNVRILDAATIDKKPVKPRVLLNLAIAAILGLFAGIGLAALLEFQDRSIKGHQDIEALGLNFLGLLPSIPGGDPSKPQERDLYISQQPKSTVAECCRTVRTNLLFMTPDNPAKRLVVTSSGPQEGKTTTVISLGIVLAQSGNRVLLIDSDMRRPRLHRSFGVSNEVGLSNLIVGEGTLEDAIKTTSISGLYVLPSGPIPPNPAELLHTERFKKLSDQLAERFDRVMYDSPPVGAVTDPLVLANQMDGTIIITKMLRTNRDLAERAVKSLRDANAKILGAVLNDVDIDKRQYGYYLGYYYSYGRYYGEGKSQA
jgi:capsular exopolysaccharide synthesis family protein